MSNVCQSCGACCATYRATFYWAEADVRGISALVVPVERLRVAMRGTESHPVRCIALAGDVGSATACTIYDHRPEICREVQPGDPSCLRARERHGLVADPFQRDAA